MSKDYPNRADWLAKRETWRNKHKYERLVWSQGTFRCRRPGPTRIGKSGVRRDKRMRRLAIYRSFFADPEMQIKIEQQKLTWCIPFHPRLVRDTVLGSR